MKVTQWFPVRLKPHRVGWYDFKGFLINQSRLYWDGHAFGYWLDELWIEMAEDSGDYWRGLAEKPKS